MSIFDEVETAEEEAGRGIEAPAKAVKAPKAPAVDPDQELADSAGISVEALRAARDAQRRCWPDGQ